MRDFGTTLAAMAVALGCLASTANAAQLTDAQAAIEQMKIKQMLGVSGVAADSKDVDGWLATFTPDGEWVTQYQRCKGAAALRAYLTNRMSCEGAAGYVAQPDAPPRTPTPAPPATTGAAPAAAAAGAAHFVAEGTITFIDDATANYRANWMTISLGGAAGPRIISVGHYDDTIVKLNGKWLIKQRQLLH